MQNTKEKTGESSPIVALKKVKRMSLPQRKTLKSHSNPEEFIEMNLLLLLKYQFFAELKVLGWDAYEQIFGSHLVLKDTGSGTLIKNSLSSEISPRSCSA